MTKVKLYRVTEDTDVYETLTDQDGDYEGDNYDLNAGDIVFIKKSKHYYRYYIMRTGQSFKSDDFVSYALQSITIKELEKEVKAIHQKMVAFNAINAMYRATKKKMKCNIISFKKELQAA